MTDKEKKNKIADILLDFYDEYHSNEINRPMIPSIYAGKIIEYLQEEPISEGLEEASKEWLKPQLDKSYANYGETKMMELTHFDGYAMLDAIEFGAKWKEQQMMKNSISKSVCLSLTGTHVELDQDDIHQLGLLFGDKIKLIAIKED